MRDFFQRHDDATWTRQGRLHVYALPNEELRQVIGRYQAALGDTATEHGLGLQPPEWAHFTVQMLHTIGSELPPATRQQLVRDLGTALVRHVPAMTLRVGPPQPSQHAVELWVDPAADEQWRHLVDTVRASAETVLGAEAVAPLEGNITPHTSIGYGIGDGDSGVLASRLKTVRVPLVEVPVTEVHLVEVTQHPGAGRFDWITHATVPLAVP